jgi:hypothetical protein
MQIRWRASIVWLALCASLAWTQAPLWTSGLLPEDRLDPSGGSLLHMGWLELGAGPLAQLASLRCAGVALVFALALACASIARRILRPFASEEVAQAAGDATTIYIAVHPFIVAAAARPAGHDLLFAMTLAALALGQLLLARQARTRARLAFAAACVVVAAAISPAARAVPLLAGLLEYGAGPRPRTGTRRWSATALVVFAAVLAVFLGEQAGRALFARETALEPADATLLAWIAAAGQALFPVVAGKSAIHAVLAALVWLVALEPLLRAARSAPRLWGRLALAAMIAVVATLPFMAGPPRPGVLDGAEVLAPAAAAAAMALSIATTAIGGARRFVLPLVGGFCLAFAARDAAQDMAAAARAADALEQRLAEEARGVSELLCLAPARDAHGFALWKHDFAERARGVPARVRLVDERCLPWLEQGALAQELARDGARIVSFDGAARVLAAPPARGEALVWRGEGRSPLVDLDPRTLRSVRVLPMPGTSPTEEPWMGWRAAEDGGAAGRIAGAWGLVDGELVALFDLRRDEAWTGAGVVRRVWFEMPLAKIKSAELRAESPWRIEAPRIDGDDWVLERLDLSWQPLSGAPRLVLRVLGEGSLAWMERDMTPVAGAWRAPGFEAEARRRLSAGEAAWWWIERMVGGRVVAEGSGRLTR